MGNKEFYEACSATANQLEQITGIKSDATQHILYERLKTARKNFARGELLLADAQIANVKFLIEDLLLIRAHDPILLKFFSKKIRQCTNHDLYFGWRMEIRMASSLINKQVEFEKSETPDFVLNSGSKFGLECTSCSLQPGEPHDIRDLSYKIQSAIRKKAALPYQLTPVILAIDISNLLFHDGKKGFPNVLTDSRIRKADFEKLISESTFDAMLTFCYAWAPTTAGTGVILTNFYNRYDSAVMKGGVLNFLDNHFPHDHFERELTIHEVV